MRKAILAAALLAGGWAGGSQAQVLQIAVDGSPAGLDPHLVTAFNSFQVVSGTIYEALTAIDRNLSIVPGLASSWTVSSDGKTYTFQLRSGVRFHSGAEMTAEDVASSIRRVQSPAIGSALASRLAAVDQAVATNPTTVTLTLKEPFAGLLTALAGIAIVPRTLEADKDTLQRAPNGTGPFRFVEWQPNSFIALAKHDGYWQSSRPQLAGVRYSIVPESQTRQAGLGSGQFHMLANIDAATALPLRGRPNVQIQDTLELAYSLIGFNTSKAPFDNPKVRAAINTALNRAEIVQAALFGAGVPGGPLSPALKDWAVDVAEFPCYRPDPARARALLAEAGVSQPITARMIVLPRQDIRDIAQVVQAQLGAIGIRVEIVNQEIGQFVQDWRNSNFDLFASTNAGSIDPDDYFFRAFRTGGSTNVYKYSNPELDRLLDLARTQGNQAERRATYAQVQRMIACEGPAAHIAYAQLFTAHRTTVRGFEILANRSLLSLGQVTIAP